MAFVCDDGYVMQTAVAITSLIHSKNSDSQYDIYVLGAHIKEENCRILQSMSSETVRISVLQQNVSRQLSQQTESDSIYRVATKAALLKFDIAELLKNEDKVIYLDGDIIVCQDLSPLFNTDLGNCYAAVVRDVPQVLFDNPLINVGLGQEYFNSGVMVMNLKLLRQENTRARLVATKQEMVDDVLMDQNVLNKVFAGRVVQLPLRYNVLYANLKRCWNENGVVQRLNQIYGSTYRRPRDLLRNAAVIHYSSKDKPWSYFDAPLANLWMDNYKKSPYAGVPLKRRCLLKQRVLNKIKQLFI